MLRRSRDDKQNVTIALSSDLVKEARHLAVDKGLSLSAYLSSLLEERVHEKKRYGEAKARALALLSEGLPLGTGGTARWTRDELHER